MSEHSIKMRAFMGAVARGEVSGCEMYATDAEKILAHWPKPEGRRGPLTDIERLRWLEKIESPDSPLTLPERKLLMDVMREEQEEGGR